MVTSRLIQSSLDNMVCALLADIVLCNLNEILSTV